MSPSRKEKIAALAVCLVPLIYFLPATLGQIVLCPDDGVLINLPMRATAARIIQSGEFPLWDSYIFGGMPFFGAIQGGVLFPPNWSFLIFSPQTAINLEMLFTYTVAGLGAFCYARRIGESIAGAFVTAFVWQFCGFMIAPTGHISSIQAASLLPWMLWAIDGYSIKRKRSQAVLISVFVALQLFAGHPQTFVYSMFLVAGYAFIMAFKKRPVNRFYFYSLAFVLSGIALAAVQMLPTLELTRHSYRQKISYSFFSSFSMPPSFLFNFFAPYNTGGGDGRFFQMPYTNLNYYAEYIGYVGLITLMLAFAAPLVRRDGITFFWCAAALVCLTLALGEFLPFCLYRLVYLIPGLNSFRVSARHLMEVDFALAVLAGRTLTAIVSEPGRENARKIGLVGIGVLTITLIAVFGSGSQSSFNALSVPEIWCPILIALIGLFLMWLLGHGYRYALVLVIFAIVFDLSLWGQFSGWHSSPKPDNEIFSEIPVINFLRQRQNEQGLFRVLTLTPPPDSAPLTALQPDTYMLKGIQNAAGYDAFGLRRYSVFTDGMKEWGELVNTSKNLGDDKIFDLLNVRYLIAKRTTDGKILTANQTIDEKLISGHWKRAAQFGELEIYENMSVLPRARLATKALVPANENEALHIIRTGKFIDGNLWDAGRTVLLDAPVEINPAGENTGSAAEITSYTANKIQLKTDCAASSVLVLAENYYPGWRVKVDGREQEILRVNYNQRGVALLPGAHEIEFFYRPVSFLSGLMISALTSIVLLLWWLGKKSHKSE